MLLPAARVTKPIYSFGVLFTSSALSNLGAYRPVRRPGFDMQCSRLLTVRSMLSTVRTEAKGSLQGNVFNRPHGIVGKLTVYVDLEIVFLAERLGKHRNLF